MYDYESNPEAKGVEYQVTKVDPTDPQTKGAVYQVHKVSEEVAATLGGKVYRARIINDPTVPTVAGKVYQIVLIGDPSDPAVKGKVYNAILTGGSEAVVVGPAVSPLDLPDAIANSLSYVKAFGGTEQNGTPTPDAPMDIVSNNGVLKLSPNLYKPGIKTEYTTNGVTISVDADGLLHLDGAPTSAVAIIFTGYDGSFANGFTFSTHLLSGTVSGANSEFYPSSSVGYNPTVKINTYGTSTRTEQLGTIFATLRTGDTFNNAVIGIQILSGIASSMPTYHPYGSVYTDGTVETINVHGKNLNGGGELENKGYTSTGGTSTSTTFCGTLWKIKVNPGEKYTVSYGNFPDGVSGLFVNTWKTDGTWNMRQAISTSGAYTYTIPAGVGEVNFTLYKTGGITITDNSWMQVEAGEIATDYEPYYDGNTATAEMLLKVGDYQDEQEILSGAVTREVGVKVLDGTEDWVDQLSGSRRVILRILDILNDNTAPLLVTHGKFAATTAGGDNHWRIIAGGFIACYTSEPTLADFKAFLADQYAAGTPVIIVYPLETPTTESVAGQTLQVTDGDNTLEITQASLDGLELEAQYNAAVSLTIQEVQDANLDNNVTVTIQ